MRYIYHLIEKKMFEEAARYKDDFCVYVGNGHYCGLVNTVYPVDVNI